MTLSVVSLFSGAGGLDYGIEAAGFEVRAAVELESDCCETLHANTRWPVIQADTSKLSGKDLLDAAGLKTGEIDLLVGGPPCQPFSKASYWTKGDARRLKDPRANTLIDYMRFVRDLQPRAFLLENVHGIAYSGKEEGFALLNRKTLAINRETGSSYSVSWRVLDAAAFGVPQHRSRFFLVGLKDGKSFHFPEATHGTTSGPPGQKTLPNAPRLKRFASAWDAIGEIQPDPDEDLSPKGYWKDLLPSIPEGSNYLWHTDRGGGLPLFGWRTRYWSFLLKLAKNQPSWTIPAQPGPAIGPFHWANRYLSERELSALQTFPGKVRFVGGRASVQRQLGNAVPSLMGEVLGRAIHTALTRKVSTGALKLGLALKNSTPPPEHVAAVPSMYLKLVGKHAAHPGTRRGPAALRAQPLPPAA
ncbi:MAG TPA: DNA cytosine methyltransferase [Thermoplasmata archaeon]|nr:DNA cytosine methyltransferase [Thermoplasmata archaeon]